VEAFLPIWGQSGWEWLPPAGLGACCRQLEIGAPICPLQGNAPRLSVLLYYPAGHSVSSARFNAVGVRFSVNDDRRAVGVKHRCLGISRQGHLVSEVFRPGGSVAPGLDIR